MRPSPREAGREARGDVRPGDIDVFFFTNAAPRQRERDQSWRGWRPAVTRIWRGYRSYHGATAAASPLTGDPRRWRGSRHPRVVHVLIHTRHRARLGVAEQSLAMLDEGSTRGRRRSRVHSRNGDRHNGVLVPPDGYMQGVRELCTKHGI